MLSTADLSACKTGIRTADIPVCSNSVGAEYSWPTCLQYLCVLCWYQVQLIWNTGVQCRCWIQLTYLSAILMYSVGANTAEADLSVCHAGEYIWPTCLQCWCRCWVKLTYQSAILVLVLSTAGVPVCNDDVGNGYSWPICLNCWFMCWIELTYLSAMLG
jgi:hypothetical protein